MIFGLPTPAINFKVIFTALSVLTILSVQVVLTWRIGEPPEMLSRKGGQKEKKQR